MPQDTQLLLVLLAVRMHGTNASAKLDVFKKLKAYITPAVAQKLVIVENKDEVDQTKGKSKKKKEAVINLTESGKAYLEAHGGAEAVAASLAGTAHEKQQQVAEAARELQQQLRSDRDALRAEVLASIAKKTKSGDPSKEIKALATKLEALSQAFVKLEGSFKHQEGSEVVARIDAAFAALEKKLHTRLGSPGSVNPLPAEKPVQIPSTSTKSLRALLREAYETLCLYIEFDSGVVEIPRLYHEARKAEPNLSVQAFHKELESCGRSASSN